MNPENTDLLRSTSRSATLPRRNDLSRGDWNHCVVTLGRLYCHFYTSWHEHIFSERWPLLATKNVSRGCLRVLMMHHDVYVYEYKSVLAKNAGMPHSYLPKEWNVGRQQNSNPLCLPGTLCQDMQHVTFPCENSGQCVERQLRIFREKTISTVVDPTVIDYWIIESTLTTK